MPDYIRPDIHHPAYDTPSFPTENDASSYDNSLFLSHGEDEPDSLLEGLLDLFGLLPLYDVLTGASESDAQFRREDYFRKLAEDFEMKKLQMQMDYNSEPAKIKRMIEAGLNPVLMSQSNSSVSTGSSVQGHTPSTSYDPRALIDNISTIFNTRSNSRLVNSQAKANEAKANLDNVEAGLRPLESSTQVKLWESTIKRYSSQNKLDEASARLLSDQADFLEVTSSDQHQQIKESVKQILAYSEMLKSQKSLFEQQKVNAEHETRVIDATAENLRADTEVKRSEKELVEAETDLTKEQEWTSYYQNILLSHQADYENAIGNIPCSVEFRDRISTLLASGRESDIELANKLLDGYLDAETQIFNKTVDNQYSNYGKTFLMNLGNAATQMLPNFNVVAPVNVGSSRGGRVRSRP